MLVLVLVLVLALALGASGLPFQRASVPGALKGGSKEHRLAERDPEFHVDQVSPGGLYG